MSRIGPKSKPKGKIGGWKKTLIASLNRPAPRQDMPPGAYHFDANGRLVPGYADRGLQPLPSVNMPSTHPNDQITKATAGVLGGAALGSTGAVLGAGAQRNLKSFKRGKKPVPESPAASFRNGELVWNSNGQPLLTTSSGGRTASRYFPKGDTKNEAPIVVSAPVVVGVQRHGDHPRLWAKAKNGDVSVTVEHTEYLRDLVTPGSPSWLNTTSQFAVNPGNKSIFAWMSDLASLFDEYEFEALEFCYEPSVGTSNAGKVLMTFDPDVIDEVPDNKQEMLQARVQLDSPVWTRAKLPVPRDLLRGSRFVRSFAVPQGMDPHVYDVGALNISLPGVAASLTAGELFVRYRIRLMTPNGGVVQAGRSAAVNPSVAAPLGTAFVSAGAIFAGWASGTTFAIPAAGSFDVVASHVGTTFGSAGGLAAAGANTVTVSSGANSATQSLVRYKLNVVDPTQLFTITAPAGAATLTQTTLYFYESDADI